VYHRLELPGWGVCLAGIGVEISDLRRYLDDLETAHLRLALLDAAATRVGTTLDIETTCLELAESGMANGAYEDDVAILAARQP
jgi:hypothetical protein